jgi:glycosyltransferase involved in cell wall biosynthesis
MFDGLVSVIIPCYNQAHFLAEAIESVLAQTYPHFEILVIDDGSSDDSSQVASHFERVRCIRQENHGLSLTRNRGAKESNGAYLLFLDADDRLLPNCLELGAKYLGEHPEIGFVAGHCRHIAQDGSPLPTPPQRAVEKDYYIELLRDNYIWPPAAVIFRRNAFESVGGFNPSLSGSADYDIFLRIAAAFPIYFYDQVVAEYRQHNTNMSSNAALMLRESVFVLQFQKERAKKTEAAYAAYKSGLKECRSFYGEPVRAKTLSSMKAHLWKQAFSGMWALFRYYPSGLFKLLLPNLYCVSFWIKDQIRNLGATLKRLILGASFGFIKAQPRVIRIQEGSQVSAIHLSWKSRKTTAVEVRVDSPDGPLLSRAGSSGSAETGDWVRDGTVFYLQDASAGVEQSPSNTMAVVTVNVIAR